jgi:hypothetical protein
VVVDDQLVQVVELLDGVFGHIVGEGVENWFAAVVQQFSLHIQDERVVRLSLGQHIKLLCGCLDIIDVLESQDEHGDEVSANAEDAYSELDEELSVGLG